MPRRSFKTDESFLEKLAIGATGTCAVFNDLKRRNHKPIELERGSLGFKIWKSIKIKRLRVPDILCLACATRIEARAKTALEISMSHSLSDPERGWDYGLLDGDMVAISLCSKTGEGPTDWQAATLIQYVSVLELRKAFNEKRVLTEKPKGAQEGFELRVRWPSAVSSCDGTVAEISPRLKCKRAEDGRTISLGLSRGGIELQPLVQAGERIHAGQIVASVVPVASKFPCRGGATAQTFVSLLKSTSVADRYAAAKALSHFEGSAIAEALRERMVDEKEHIYVRVESAAGLARRNDRAGMEFIERVLAGEYLEHRLEAVIILGEIRTDASQQILTRVLLDKEQHAEIRAGAAWALGELQQPTSADALIQSFLELAEPIRIEAARALRKIAANTSADILSSLPKAEEDQRAGISWAVSRSGKATIPDFLRVMSDENARRWVAYIIGSQKQEAYLGEIEALRQRDPEVYFAVTVLWKIFASWVYELEEF
jgi:HEAT repeat protein